MSVDDLYYEILGHLDGDEALWALDDLAARCRNLELLLSEHHAAGALDGVLIGDECPVCAKVKA